MNKTLYWLLGIVFILGLIYLIIVRIIPSGTKSDSMEAVSCTNKTVYRYKNPEDMFPVITRDYSTNFQIATGVLNKLAGDTGNSTVSVGVKSEAQQLVETLNQDNIFFQNSLKAYFLESNNDPCNDSLKYLYTSFIKEMTDKQIQLKQFIAQITSSDANTEKVTDTGKNKVLAVVDTSKGKVDTSVHNISPNRLIVLKDYQKLNSAVNTLSNKYKVLNRNNLVRPQ